MTFSAYERSKGEIGQFIMINILTFRKCLRYLDHRKHIFRRFKAIGLKITSSRRYISMDDGGSSKMGLRPNSQWSSSCENLLFKFGVISDVQYADVEDRLNFDGSVMRYYRNSVKLLRKAVEMWKVDKPHFVVQLGDIVEGNHVPKKDRDTTLQTVLDACKDLPCYVCHLWGNHEFYLFSRAELVNSSLNSKVQIDEQNCKSDTCNGVSELNGPRSGSILINNVPHNLLINAESGEKYYFAFSPNPKFKFIAIDSYDISICGREEGQPEYEEAKQILTMKNSNDNWNSPHGLKEPHYVKFNGGVSKEQLDWLDKELEIADKKNQVVIILSHIPVHPESTIFLCNIWNYQDILDVIWKHSCVKLCLCGHSHEDGELRDHKGIQHIVFPAVLECKEPENAFANVYVYENKIKISGFGKVKSFDIDL